jgi:hypothetical protein
LKRAYFALAQLWIPPAGQAFAFGAAELFTPTPHFLQEYASEPSSPR